MFKPFTIIFLIINILQVFLVAWGAEPAVPNPPLGLTPELLPPGQIRLWLDEVRAQREFINARHRAARESTDARLRAVDPWVADRVEEAARESNLRRELANQRRKSLENAIKRGWKR